MKNLFAAIMNRSTLKFWAFKNLPLTLFILAGLNFKASAQASQDNLFPLSDIKLTDGPFKTSMDLNIQTLLEYDVDRLLQPFLTEAGLTAKGAAYANWSGLAGHVGGHYLSALAIHYASTGDTNCKQRMDYIISELKKCQEKNANGYVGGVPNSKSLWTNLSNGDFGLYYSVWVPWYNLHKTYAGLRDAWLYGESETAKQMFLALCDWGIVTISKLSDTQIQTMLGVEFGGMNEVYVDAYKMTGQQKYLDAAKKFTHKYVFDALSKNSDILDNLHANTQIPKFVGFASVALNNSQETTYLSAASNFWQTVVTKRSLALGGNSRREYFPAATACKDYLVDREGPESCNTYNMLKLSSQLHGKTPEVKYADFYERALFNHILSTQNPEHGGYVYFTPARPMHYRVYSAPNEAMWCCVGTGMENHGKHGQFIYSETDGALYVNLFIASELNWEEKGVTIKQTTDFPREEGTTLEFTGSASFKLKIRYPSWVAKDSLKVIVNGDEYPVLVEPGQYMTINRDWVTGDVVKIKTPMHLHIEEMPNVPDYVAILYGPILLGARGDSEGLSGLVADDGRWAHIASGSLIATYDAPIVVSKREEIVSKIKPVKGEPLHFTVSDLFPDQPRFSDLVLEPFYQIHDARYMMYWMALDPAEAEEVLAEMKQKELESLITDARTLDYVSTGEQQPESDHKMQTLNSTSGIHENEYWRDASSGGYFSYELATQGRTDLTLQVKYWGNESGTRVFDILVDETIIATENVVNKWNVNEFRSVEYPIDASLVAGKEIITVKFKARTNAVAGGVFYVRLLKNELATDASLMNLEVNGSSLEDFEAAKFDYTYSLLAGSELPLVTASTTHEKARIQIENVDELPGSAKITVTAEDQVTKIIYQIDFELIPLVSADGQTLLVYPNPAKDFIRLDVRFESETELMAVDLSGKTVKSWHISGAMPVVDIREMASGTYVFSFQKGGIQYYFRLIKE